MGTDLEVCVEGDFSARILSSLITVVNRDVAGVVADYVGRWRTLTLVDIPRNYRLFGLLAGVRGPRGRKGYVVCPPDRPLLRDEDGYDRPWITLDEADPSTNESLSQRFYGQWTWLDRIGGIGEIGQGHKPLSCDWLELIDAAAKMQHKHKCPIRFRLIFES